MNTVDTVNALTAYGHVVGQRIFAEAVKSGDLTQLKKVTQFGIELYDEVIALIDAGDVTYEKWYKMFIDVNQASVVATLDETGAMSRMIAEVCTMDLREYYDQVVVPTLTAEGREQIVQERVALAFALSMMKD